MSKEKQIEEMAKVLDECCNRYDENGKFLGNKCSNCEYFCDTNHLCCSYGEKEATAFYNAGYRKQSEGEWEVCSDEYEICADEFVCSICKESFVSSELTDEEFLKMMKFCPNCGAKMKGERT